jgi:pimeloyl-ACP methyl ester carboxylesterase
MATIVLIHGAWTGGWLWSRVAPDLRARGQTVHIPTLTGLGERDHLLGPDIDLDLHATDVLNLLEYEDLQRTVLVGHGYGAAVAQRVAALAPERVGRLLFLDALLARPGQSLVATLGPAADLLQTRAYDDEGIAVYAPDTGLLLDSLAKRDADWVEDRLVPMPAAPFAQPLDLAGFFALDRPVLVVRPQRGDPAAAIAEEIAREYGFAAHEIDGGHLVMIAKPDATAELIDNFARQPAARFAKQDG